MSRKQKTVTRKAVYARMKKAQAAHNADMNARIAAANAPPLPSHEAMGLAEMVLDRAARKKDKGEVTQVVVAEMLDSALRVRRAAAEVGGIQKGAEETRETFERQILDGVIGRINGYANQKKGFATIAISFHEALVVKDALRKAGYGPQPHHVVGPIEASHERV